MMTTNQTKYVILVGDGMGDLPIDGLGGVTPLEKATTPAMDFISQHGQLGLLRTVPEGYPPGSDVANLSLLGYRPENYYTGRAPLEAASLGVALAEDEIAYRCNLVTIEHRDNQNVTMIDYSADHIDSESAAALIKSLNQELAGETARFYPGVSYRHLLVVKGISPVVETVPPHDFTGKDVSHYWQEYLDSPLAEYIRKAHEILTAHKINRDRCKKGKHPANSIWLWGEGRPPSMPSLVERFGLNGALISAVDLLKGMGVYAGLEIINVPGATGYLDTNYQGKAEAALAALKDKDFVFVHVEAPDEAGHQGLVQEKIQAIEDFDQKIVQPILDGLKKKQVHFRLALTMDHFTPISIRTHSVEPVPIVIYDSHETSAGSLLTYNEKNAPKTGVFYESGDVFFQELLQKRT